MSPELFAGYGAPFNPDGLLQASGIRPHIRYLTPYLGAPDKGWPDMIWCVPLDASGHAFNPTSLRSVALTLLAGGIVTIHAATAAAADAAVVEVYDRVEGARV